MATTNKTQRVNFSTMQQHMPYPDFLEIQLKSFHDFLQMDSTPEQRRTEGLFKVFSENFPIQDTRNSFKLEFLDYSVDRPRYTIEECIKRGLTYSVPLKAKLRLSCEDPDHEDFDTIVEDVYLGTIPYMTPKGTFVINGAERVVVSQLHRSPGVFFGTSMHSNGTKLYSARIIPFRGSWIEFATDINKVMYEELMETLNLPKEELQKFAGDVLERFVNPFVDHQVTSIMLNSFPKYETRDLPGLKTYLARKGELPKGLVLGLAAIITYYKGGVREDGAEIIPNDAPEIMSLLKDLWATGDTRKVAEGVLAEESIWKSNLNEIPGLTDLVVEYLDSIQKVGMLETVNTIL